MVKNWFGRHNINSNANNNNDTNIKPFAERRSEFFNSLKVPDSDSQPEKESAPKITSSNDSDADDMDTSMSRGNQRVLHTKSSRLNSTDTEKKSVVPDASKLAPVDHGRTLFMQKYRVTEKQPEKDDSKDKDGDCRGENDRDELDNSEVLDNSVISEDLEEFEGNDGPEGHERNGEFEEPAGNTGPEDHGGPEGLEGSSGFEMDGPE